MSEAKAKMKVEVGQFDPENLKLLDVNARYMRHETFARLTENVANDNALTSVPFAWMLYDDKTRKPILDEDGKPIYEVLSGNHRIKAARAAELKDVHVLYTDQYLTPDQRKGIQLSHNELTGEDDPAILKTIYESIEDVGMRVYSGLDDRRLELLEEEIDSTAISEANLMFQNISMVFLPDELEEVEEAWEAAKKELAGMDEVWLARYRDYDQFMETIETTSNSYRVKNLATCLMLVLEVFKRNLTDLRDGWLDENDEVRKSGGKDTSSRSVPLSTILGWECVAAQTAATYKKAADRLKSEGLASDYEDALRVMAENVLNKEPP